ncbi:uncharacterized protein LOC128668424 [Microplitis demolitor]|uniref:uncharacterized protein LOC128668424 n=1 Tax=Microplitis demolitor TaxID=69319 RepID=UPI00235B659C|nr:uncharacterized protein LOC128668424 [Microplitis demolitor]
MFNGGNSSDPTRETWVNPELRRLSARRGQSRRNNTQNPGSSSAILPVPTISISTNSTNVITTTTSSCYTAAPFMINSTSLNAVVGSGVVPLSSPAGNNGNFEDAVVGSGGFPLNLPAENTRNLDNTDRLGENPPNQTTVDGQNVNNALGREEVPPDMRILFDRMNESSRQVQQMTRTQRLINEENSASINELARMLNQMMTAQVQQQQQPRVENNNQFQQASQSGQNNQQTSIADQLSSLQEQLRQLQLNQRQQSNSEQGQIPSYQNSHQSVSVGDREPTPTQHQRNLGRNVSPFVEDRRWKDIIQGLKMGNIFYPQENLTVDEFLHAVEARANREDWTDKELLRVMSYILHGASSRWYDLNYNRWSGYLQFKTEFRKAFGSPATDHRIIMDISKMRMNKGDNVTEFVLKIQQKYQSKNIPPPVEDQVACIRNHLTDELRTLVFARQVHTYEGLLNALNEATRCIEEAHQLSVPQRTVKFQDKPRFGLLQSPTRETAYEEDDQEYTQCNIMEPNSQSTYNKKYGVQMKTNNNYNRIPYQNRQQMGFRPRVNQFPRSPGFNQAPIFVPRSNKPCFNCGIMGHNFEVCVNPRQEVCNLCFGIGHTRDNCELIKFTEDNQANGANKESPRAQADSEDSDDEESEPSWEEEIEPGLEPEDTEIELGEPRSLELGEGESQLSGAPVDPSHASSSRKAFLPGILRRYPLSTAIKTRLAGRKIFVPGTVPRPPIVTARIPVSLWIFGIKLNGILDTGSERSYINAKVYEDIREYASGDLQPDETKKRGILLANHTICKSLGGAPFIIQIGSVAGEQYLSVLEDLGYSVVLSMDFVLQFGKPGATPVRIKPYRRSPVINEELNRQIDELLEKKFIRPSYSVWSCSPVMVSKPNNKWRFCVDYRPINKWTIPPAHPLPNMLRIPSALHGAISISTMDLKEAFHQIRMSPASIPLTAFSVEGRGQYQWLRMPYGLVRAPSTFQKAMDELKDRLHKKLVDENLPMSLLINPAKCKFCRPEVKFLGFIVNQTGLHPDPEKIAPIANYPRPTNRKQLRSFLGLVNWYHRHLQDVAKAQGPLNKLTGVNTEWKWEQQEEESLQKLKHALIDAQPLAIPKVGLPYYLYTDACDTGIGAFLVQRDFETGKEYLIICLSRQLRGAETRYTTTEKECLAVVWAVRKLRCYLEGAPFTVVTDHASLKWLHSLRDPNGRLARWAIEILSHQITIEHRRGTENEGPDAISRMGDFT